MSSGDTAATFARNPYTFLTADAGVKTLDATLNTVGIQSITANDGTFSGMQSGISVSSAPTAFAFTTPGTTIWTCPAGVTAIQLLVVGSGGGGGGGGSAAGGGGAGGLVYYGSETPALAASYAVTPGQTYTVTIGAGGGIHTKGQNSSFGTVVAVGGGYGGERWTGWGGAGASGGGGGLDGNGGIFARSGGAATPAGQGSAGGSAFVDATDWTNFSGGGGGGAGSAGFDGAHAMGGNGGAGLPFSISGSAVTYAGGGGGRTWGEPGAGFAQGSGGTGGGGNAFVAGAGGLGGGGGANAAGGSGIVIVNTNVQPGSPYQTWAGTHAFDSLNSEGVAYGMAWILGAPNNSSPAIGRLPQVMNASGSGFTVHFTRVLDPGAAKLYLEYSDNLEGWSSPVEVIVGDGHHADPGGSGITFDVTTTGELYDITAQIPPGLTEKRFARLQAQQ